MRDYRFRTERGVSVLQHEETGLCPIVERMAASSRDPKPDPRSRICFVIFHPFTDAHAPLVFAQETGRNITGAVPLGAGGPRPVSTRVEHMSAVGELAFRRSWRHRRPSAGARRRRRRGRAAGAGAVRRGFRTSEASLSSDRGRRALAEAREPNKKGKSPPKKGKSPPKKGKSPPTKGKPEGQKKGQTGRDNDIQTRIRNVDPA